jgi:hypothetical protein
MALCYDDSMHERFDQMLLVGGKSNSLGRVPEVINLVLRDESRLGELYDCLFADNAWLRMRAADALEKICRLHPDWLLPYVDRFLNELATSTQPSIQWHLAQIYNQVELTTEQKQVAADWLASLLSTTDVDWIVAANAMDTLARLAADGSFPKPQLVALLQVQQHHKSSAVIKRATKWLAEPSLN